MTTKYHQISFNVFFQTVKTDSLLLLFLNLCKELRDFYIFSKVPYASLVSRFKHNFDSYIELMFKHMVLIIRNQSVSQSIPL